MGSVGLLAGSFRFAWTSIEWLHADAVSGSENLPALQIWIRPGAESRSAEEVRNECDSTINFQTYCGDDSNWLHHDSG